MRCSIKKTINNEKYSGLKIKVLLLSLFPIIPWIILGKLFIGRNYEVEWTNFIYKLDTYFFKLSSNMPWIIFFLFLFSIIFILFKKRSTLPLFFGFLFIAYYFFYTGDSNEDKVPRFTIVLYPTIAVYSAILISSIIHKIKQEHLYKPTLFLITAYMIFACLGWQVSFDNSKLQFYRVYTYFNIYENPRYFPLDNAMSWIKNNVKEKEKLIILAMPGAEFYRHMYRMTDKNIIIFGYDLDLVSTHQKLKTYCKLNKIDYIMFMYSPDIRFTHPYKYLKVNEDNDFEEIAKFTRSNKNIIISKLKQHSL